MTQLRGSVPQPFQRPSVSISETDVSRVWQHVIPTRLSPGDVVAEVGSVAQVDTLPEGGWKITGRYATERVVPEGGTVFAFTALGQ